MPPGAARHGEAAPAGERIAAPLKIAGTGRHAALIADCIGLMDIFRLSRQLETPDRVVIRVSYDMRP